MIRSGENDIFIGIFFKVQISSGYSQSAFFFVVVYQYF